MCSANETGTARMCCRSRRAFALIAYALAVVPIGCKKETLTEPPTADGLQFRAEVRFPETQPRGVSASLAVENVTDTVRRIEWSSCRTNYPVLLRVYLAEGTAPAWDQTAAYRLEDCPMVLNVRRLQPRETFIFPDFNVPITHILGDSLPSGTYRITIHPKYLFNDAGAELNNPPARPEIDVGSFRLER